MTDHSLSVFQHGVASGDPLPDGVLLWTRLTPTPRATPGSGRGPRATVRWTVATDPALTAVVAEGTASTGPERDHTVTVDVRGLAPATDHWYRFAVDGAASPVGRTRTAPASGAAVDRLRFGVACCANWEAGYFSAYRHLARRGDLDAVLLLGDYVYEYATGEYAHRGTVVRPHLPAHETVTLADYRLRHGTHRTDPDLRALHATAPVISVWDDHEFADNASATGARGHQPDREGPWAARVAAARQAYLEWIPVRPSPTGTVDRRLRFGRLADLSLLDLRSFRTGAGTPQATITGRAQMDRLKADLAASDAVWRLVGNPVMISPLSFLSLPEALLRPLAALFGLDEDALAINPDQWDGFPGDRRELVRHLRDHRIPDTVFVTGDAHSTWVAELPVDAGTYPVSGSVATEFVVTSVTSDNIDDKLDVPEHTASLPIAAALRAVNRHLHHVDLDTHGYGVLEVTPHHVQMDHHAVSDRTDPRATSRWLRSYRVRTGTHRPERVTHPVDPRRPGNDRIPRPTPQPHIESTPDTPTGPTIP